MPKSTPKGIKQIAAVVTFVLLVALIFPFRWNHIAYFHNSIDLLGTVWSVSHVSNAISSGQNPWITHQMLSPDGISILSHTSDFIVGVVDSCIKNPILSLNIVMFVNFVVLAWGFYNLTSIWISDPWIQMGVATMTVFTAYYQSKFGIHINLILQCTVPWTAYCWLKSVRLKPSIAINNLPLFIAGCVLAIVGLFFDYYTAIALSFVLLPWVIWELWAQNAWTHKSWKRGLIATFSLFVVHLVGRFFNMGGLDKKGGIWEAADIRQLFVPSNLGYWNFSNATYPQSPSTENFVYLGWSLIVPCLVFGLIFLYQKRKIQPPNVLPFVWFSVILSLIVVLPVIRLNGQNLFYTPSALMHFIPVLDHFRMPTRMVPIVHFYGALLLSCYLYRLKSQLKRWYVPLILSITVLFLIEHKAKTPEFFSMKDYSLSQTDKDLLPNNTVLSFPWGVRDGLKEMGQFNAFDYALMLNPDIRLTSAYISRISANRWQQVQSDSFFVVLSRAQKSTQTRWSKHEQMIVLDGINNRKITAVRIPKDYSYLADQFKAIESIRWIETKTPSCLYLVRDLRSNVKQEFN